MRILLTAAGYQGAYDLVQYLKAKGHTVIGTDMNRNTAARFYCDKFYFVSSGLDNQYHLEISKIINAEKPDVILPGSSYDVQSLSSNKEFYEKGGTVAMVGDVVSVKICLDKYLTYRKLDNIIPLPYFLYSEGGIVVKPTKGKGSRGIKYLNEKFATEKLEGEEIDIDVLSMGKELLIAEPKTRERVYGGTLWEGEIVDRPELVEHIRTALKEIPLDYLSVWQFIGDKLIEINPRIAGAVIDYGMVEKALGLTRGEKIESYQIPYGKRVSSYMTKYEK